MKKILIILALAVLVAAYFFFGLGDYLTVDGIKQVAGEVGGYYERNPLQVIALFFLTYVAVTAASLPGAAVMTLAAGALFGVVVGTIVVSFASCWRFSLRAMCCAIRSNSVSARGSRR